MNITVNPEKSRWSELCSRKNDDDTLVRERVEQIIRQVRRGGDDALRSLTLEIDGFSPVDLKVSEEEFKDAEAAVPQSLRKAIATARENILKFHDAQRFTEVEVETFPGVKCVQRALPIERIGLYIPGGSAPLFSTVLMLAIPAMVAGCPDIIICTPADKNGKVAPQVLWTAQLCGIRNVYKAGGAIAVAAMAYGTESISRRDKIFGPGNRYVTTAKQMVSGDVAIDMPAGPSEVMILSDETAVPSFVAADMLSQAEHGPDSQAMLVCSCESFAEAVAEEIKRQTALLPRRSIVERALEESRMIVFDNKDDIVSFANEYAPEHLIISMSDPWNVASLVKAAGSVFIGNWSPESAGDYASGTNHTLPTSSWARSMGGVNVDSFQRKITYQELTPEGLSSLSGTIVAMAQGEGLDAHANAVKVRLDADERHH